MGNLSDTSAVLRNGSVPITITQAISATFSGQQITATLSGTGSGVVTGTPFKVGLTTSFIEDSASNIAAAIFQVTGATDLSSTYVEAVYGEVNLNAGTSVYACGGRFSLLSNLATAVPTVGYGVFGTVLTTHTSGTMPMLRGGGFTATQNGTGGTVTWLEGVFSSVTNTAGTVTNSACFMGLTTGTIGTAYGLYLSGTYDYHIKADTEKYLKFIGGDVDECGAYFYAQDANPYILIYGNSTKGYLFFNSGATHALAFYSTGVVEVNSSLYIGTVAAAPGGALNIGASGLVGLVPSLKEFKTNITDINLTSDEILSLQPREFDWVKSYLNPKQSVERNYGFIVEEVESIMPGIVYEFYSFVGEDGQPAESYDEKCVKKMLKGVGAERLIPLMYKVLKEHHQDIKNLKSSLEK